MTNPLLKLTFPIPFHNIRPEHAEPALDQILADNRATVAELVKNSHYTWDNFIAPLEEMDDRLHQMWSTVSHLHSVMNSSEWREVYQNCLPKLSEYSTELGQHEGLFHAYQSIDHKPLDAAQRKIIDNALRDFHLSGVDLEPAKKKRYGELVARLSELSSLFENHVMDATDNWTHLITDPAECAGLPKHTLEATKQKDKEGWLLTLDYPCYEAVIAYSENRALREIFYTAYCTRASDQGSNAGRWDNGPLMIEILQLRTELAQLLGFSRYTQRSLAKKMAKTPDEVIHFLTDLAERSRDHALLEWKELCEFAGQSLEAWDIAYYTEKLLQQRYGISDEKIRPYFPVDHVLKGLFETIKRLYNIAVRERTDVETWHPDVRFFELYDANQQLRGQCYLDLYARPKKRGGAWMDDARGRRRLRGDLNVSPVASSDETARAIDQHIPVLDGLLSQQERHLNIQIPVAYLTCNAAPPTKQTPALFTHDEVITLFHEFGHGLQHLLTQIDYSDVAGINGIPWDAVELPSQFMENWCWQRESLQYLSSHYQTGEPLPDEWIDSLVAAKNFQAGLHITRQVLLASFDFRLHNVELPVDIQALLDDLRANISVIPTPSFNRFQHSFTHIFAGGYAAGYYSYLWAEVLASDAFSAFEENGIFDATTGQKFLKTILEQGGSRDPLDLFIEFRGRAPTIDALLRHSGLS